MMTRSIQLILVVSLFASPKLAQAEGTATKSATVAKTKIKVPKSALEKGNWEYLETKKGIKLSRKKIGNRGLFAVRGELVINQPVEKVVSAVYDESRWSEWTEIASGQ